jgi:hypothetical protein
MKTNQSPAFLCLDVLLAGRELLELGEEGLLLDEAEELLELLRARLWVLGRLVGRRMVDRSRQRVRVPWRRRLVLWHGHRRLVLRHWERVRVWFLMELWVWDRDGLLLMQEVILVEWVA